MPISVLLADDHKIFRAGIKILLEQEDGLSVIAETEDGASTVKVVQELLPDVAILDINMGAVNGIETARAISAATRKTKVIILSMHINKEYVSEALNSGVKGYLAKTCSASDLVSSIKEVAAGRIYLSPTISHTLHGLISTPLQSSAAVLATPPPVDHNLSRRELQVLKLLAEGGNTKEIASILEISAKTVETYRYNLMKKLGIVNVAGLVKYAIRNKIIEMA